MTLRRSVFLAGARGALAAGASVALALPVGAQTLQPLRLQTLPLDAGSEPYDAEDMGFFTKQGLDVTVQSIASGQAGEAAILSGAIDIGYTNVFSLATAYKRGLPFVFIAPGNVYSSAAATSLLMVPKDSLLKTAPDLDGKTIAVNALKGIAQFAAAAWIDKNGGDSTTVKWVEIPPPEMAAALDLRRVDAVVIGEPQITQAKVTSRTFAKVYDVIGDGFMVSGFFATRAWAEAHPDLVRKFQAAMRETAAWANANPDKSVAVLAKYMKLDPGLVRASVRTRFASTLSPAAIQPTIELAARYKIFESFPAQELIFQPK